MTTSDLPAPRAPDALPDAVWIEGGVPLRGRVAVPGDKAISHRALMIAALAEGESTIRHLSNGEDVRRTRMAISALGAIVRDLDGEDHSVVIEGGPDRLHAPATPIDCGNSGSSMRFLAGLTAGIPGTTVLMGDDSLSLRPMDRVAEPLTAMGAKVEGEGSKRLPPLKVHGGTLHGVSWTPEVASAQVKSAILLAGICAEGTTMVTEPVRTRTHTEELLELAGSDIEVVDDGPSRVVRVSKSKLSPITVHVPGDPSQAAFWVVAACIVPGSEIEVGPIYLGAERTGFVDVLRRMGADIAVIETGSGVGDLRAHFGPLVGIEVHAAEIPSLDEVPILAVAAVVAEGTTVFRSVGELRVKETDRLEGVAMLAESLGAMARIDGDDLTIVGRGGPPLTTAAWSRGDHRMAMAAMVGACAVEGHGRVGGISSIATSDPDFMKGLIGLGGRVSTDDPVIIAIDGPAGSGKSTLARALAERLECGRLDTGAMYRAVAWQALEEDVSATASDALEAIARAATLSLEDDTVTMNGVDVTRAIRESRVNEFVSAVAATASVRTQLVRRQRHWIAEHRGGVVEGRDIGTVVMPDARVKIYLTASEDERARRRQEERDIERRDRIDSTRATSPLHAAKDAHMIDTTDRGVDHIVEEVMTWL